MNPIPNAARVERSLDPAGRNATTPVTAIIVTYESAAVIGACIDSCLRAGTAVIVIDNASQDATVSEARKHPTVRVIANPVNLGFGAAVNQGVEAAATGLILLLNPDAILQSGLSHLVAACQSPGIAAASGLLLDIDGNWQRGFSIRRLPSAFTLSFEVLGLNRIFPSNPVNRRYRCLDLPINYSGDVEQPAGAFVLFRRDAWFTLGGFDENFFPIWFEDVDFCKRLKDNDLRIVLEPRASARHVGGLSASRLTWESREQCWYASLLRYAAKHFPRSSLAGVGLTVIVGSLLRIVMGIRRRGARKSIRVYGKVIRLACRYLISGAGGGSRSKDSKNTDQAQIHVL